MRPVHIVVGFVAGARPTLEDPRLGIADVLAKAAALT
jgi:hypothetical protein